MLKQLFIATSLVSATFGAEIPVTLDNVDTPSTTESSPQLQSIENPEELEFKISALVEASSDLSQDRSKLIEMLWEISGLCRKSLSFSLEYNSLNLNNFKITAPPVEFFHPMAQTLLRQHSGQIVSIVYKLLSDHSDHLDSENIGILLSVLARYLHPSLHTPEVTDQMLIPSHLDEIGWLVARTDSNNKDRINDSLCVLLPIMTHTATKPEHFKRFKNLSCIICKSSLVLQIFFHLSIFTLLSLNVKLH